MKKIILLFCVAIPLALSAQNEGMQFLGDSTLQSALAKAKQTNKLLFVDCYTSWCGPCKYMSTTIFPMPEVGKFYNEHFLNWKIDCEKVNKIDTATFRKYSIHLYPTFLFLNSDGKIVHIGLGSRPAAPFVELGRVALDSTRNYVGLKKKILLGDRSSTTLHEYYMSDINAPTQYIDDHFALVDDSIKMSKESWLLFNYFMKDIDGPAFRYFKEHKAQYEQKFGKENVDRKLTNLLSYYARPGKEKQYELLSQIDTVLTAKVKLLNQLEVQTTAYRNDPSNKENLKKLIAIATLLDKQNKLEVWMSNELSWLVYENYKKANDMNALKQAEVWSKKTVDAQPDTHAFVDTYAHIIFDLGRKKEAIQREEFALKKAIEENAPNQIKFYTDEIKRFKGEK